LDIVVGRSAQDQSTERIRCGDEVPTGYINWADLIETMRHEPASEDRSLQSLELELFEDDHWGLLGRGGKVGGRGEGGGVLGWVEDEEGFYRWVDGAGRWEWCGYWERLVELLSFEVEAVSDDLQLMKGQDST
jgi:hypothetical protein